MIDFYNAFISYRHAELDSKVAEHVQRSLEHFAVPRAIRKKTGRKKIERIFRDKDELPITSDLTDTISNALEKAEYLIVICSPNTCESFWVQREINFFLKNHSKKQILTVLAGGEPNDVIPEILKTDTRTVTDDDGTERTVKVNIEPLSCDYRMPFKRALKEEIPRLAAALIGCSYDELVRRQRAYRTRRLLIVSAVVAAAAIAFGTYMYIAKKRVDDALRQSLISQSRYLASESEALLEQERRIDGLYLALAAVPTDLTDPMPVTSEGVAALARATVAYRGMAGNNIDCLWNYNVGNQIKDMAVNEDGTRLAAINSLGAITVWDTETHNELFGLINPDANILEVIFADGDKLLVLGGNKFCAYDSTTGELIWELDAASQASPEDAWMLSYNDAGIEIIQDGQVMVFIDGRPSAWVIDTSDGSITEQYDMNYEIDGYTGHFSHFQLSPDKTRICFSIFMGLFENYTGIYDLSTERFEVSDPINEYISDVMWYDDDHFLVSAFDIDAMESAKVDDSYVIRPNYSDIFCYDPDRVDLKWQAEHVCNGLNLHRGFVALQANDMIAFYSGDTCTAYNIDTGEAVYNWNTTESIVDVSDRDSNGWPLMITDGGGMVFPVPNLGSDVVDLTYEFADNLNNVVVNHGVYVYQEYGEEIIYYNVGVWDDDWTQIEGITTSDIVSSYLGDEVLAIIYESGDEIRMAAIDPERAQITWDSTVDFDESYYFSLDILGVYDGDLIVMNSSAGLHLYRIDIEDGSYDRINLTDNIGVGDHFFLHGDYVSYLYTDFPDQRVGIYNLDTDDIESFAIPTDEIYNIDVAPHYYQELGCMYVSTADGDIIIKPEYGLQIEVDLPADWNGTVCLNADVQTALFIVSDGKQIILVDDEGDIVTGISTGGRRPLGMEILRRDEEDEGTLIVAYSEGQLARYNPATGEFLGSSDLSTYVDHICEAQFIPDWENGYLYVQMDHLTDIVHVEDWIEEAYINNCFGYYMALDRFYTMSFENSSERSIGYYRHYSLEDLIDKAREILGDNFEIPEEIRSLYGL